MKYIIVVIEAIIAKVAGATPGDAFGSVCAVQDVTSPCPKCSSPEPIVSVDTEAGVAERLRLKGIPAKHARRPTAAEYASWVERTEATVSARQAPRGTAEEDI